MCRRIGTDGSRPSAPKPDDFHADRTIVNSAVRRHGRSLRLADSRAREGRAGSPRYLGKRRPWPAPIPRSRCRDAFNRRPRTTQAAKAIPPQQCQRHERIDRKSVAATDRLDALQVLAGARFASKLWADPPWLVKRHCGYERARLVDSSYSVESSHHTGRRREGHFRSRARRSRSEHSLLRIAASAGYRRP